MTISCPAGARRAILRVCAAAIGTAIGIATIELAFGSWLRSNPWERARALNIIVDRHVTYDATALYDDSRPVSYTRDAYGLRGSFGEPRNITILTIGGSTTDQRFISDGATWQDELQRQLRGRGIPASVANAGVDGHTTFGHLASFQHWFPLIPNLRPRQTILFVGLNDLFVEGPELGAEGRSDGAATLASRIQANSALYRLTAPLLGTLQARRSGLGHWRVDVSRLPWVDTPLLRHHDSLITASVSSFDARFTKLLYVVRQTKSMPICVTQPAGYYRLDDTGRVWGVGVDLGTEIGGVALGALNGVDFFYLKRQLDHVILSACPRAGGHAIDLATAQWETTDFYDYVHMTPSGAQKLGRRIADAMNETP